ncbi:branched-chain amino acid transport system ATP-binding protein [Allocatelliglobosispora scoriae]|uniref:Branched-chain amino acid transport system ATP-binding protein n=1 Tax=Allocatelliglobosispora scoriae TaxID=643052 RepID=A0A841C0E3_9ACTN|nr:ATP-binding cassette domain-containing protein [Allocatelliglobosispora scoriae]MBB5873326.1 branched-chain amino acid transport system ATP-binding protein [Allocatelliglobosispora scoriae]
MPADALTATSIHCSYGAVQVLFGLTMRVAPGETVAVCGPNGVGKSTLLRVLSGLLRPSSGTVELAGADITRVPAVRRVRLGLSTVVGQAAFGSLSVLDNLRIHGYAGSRTDTRHGVDAALAVFPRLAQRAHQPASTLSGGERQMLVLAKALVQRPTVLLIDELSLGLAPIVVGGLMEMVRRLNATGMTVVVVEQSVNVALALADRLYFLEKGTVAAEHTAAELAGRPELVRSLMLGGQA